MTANEVHGYEPLLKGEVCILKDSSYGAREVMLALIAAVASVRTSCTVVLSAYGAYNVLTPPCLRKCFLADFLIVEVVNHCDNRVEFAEIYHILCTVCNML